LIFLGFDQTIKIRY